MLERISKKFQILSKTLSLVYSQNPFQAVLRDVLFVFVVALQMYMIKVGGSFIDSTAEVLLNWKAFNIVEYLYTDSFYFLVLGLAIWMIIRSFEAMRSYLSESIHKHVLFHMQGELLNVISKSNLEDVESKEFRDLLTYVPTFSYENVIATYKEFSDAISGLLSGISAIVILFPTLGWYVFLIFLIILPENIAEHLNREKRKEYNSKEVETLKRINYMENLMTRIQYFSELRVDNTFQALKDKYAKDCMRYMTGFLELVKHFHIDTTLFEIVDRLISVLFVIFALIVSITKSLSIGHFKALYDYIYAAYNGFSDFIFSVLRIATYIDYDEKYFEYVEYKGFGDVAHGIKTLKDQTPNLAISNLHFNYPGTNKVALKDIDITIKAGERVVILGGDGSGKSTFAKVLCGLYKIDSGDYLIDGYPIQDLNRGELKKHISVLFQDYVNYNLSVKENITLAQMGHRMNHELYKQVIEICGIDKMMEKEDIDEDQMLGKYFSNGRELSPGYWQRLALARMLYRDRNIFILDEPFTYIDEYSRENILKKIMKFLGKTKTLIFITQDDDYVALFDKAFLLKNGKLTEYSKDKEW